MNAAEPWKTTFDTEIRRATDARLAGNEGMARVCARRAAGVLVGEYLKRRGIDPGTPSAYDQLLYLSGLPGISPQVAQTTHLLLMRITPEHTLPEEADLIAEALRLRQELVGE